MQMFGNSHVMKFSHPDFVSKTLTLKSHETIGSESAADDEVSIMQLN